MLALAECAANKIRNAGGKCIAIPGDASDVAFIREMVAIAVSKFGRVTLAVANAGLSLYGDFFEFPEQDFDRVMKVNLGGSFLPGPDSGKTDHQTEEWRQYLIFE